MSVVDPSGPIMSQWPIKGLKEGLLKCFRYIWLLLVGGNYKPQWYSRLQGKRSQISSSPENKNKKHCWNWTSSPALGIRQMTGTGKVARPRNRLETQSLTTVDMRALSKQGAWWLNFKNAPSFRWTHKNSTSQIHKPLQREMHTSVWCDILTWEETI